MANKQKYSNDLQHGKAKVEQNKNTIKSSFPGLFKYSGIRGTFHPNVSEWLEAKRRDDNIGELWRVHDKLYNLEEFKFIHPGGRDWIEFSKGTDITEAFESSHFVNLKYVESLLAKYYVADAKTQRNSPYTFEPNGFYKTLKKRIEPVMKNIGMGPSREAIILIDSIAVAYAVLALIGVIFYLKLLLLGAGIALGMLIVAAHNFFHKKDNWRRFYFDLSVLSSYEWRISHGFSHHLYPNTILDFEILMGEPIVEMLPVRPKSFFHKYILPFIIDSLYVVFGLEQVAARIVSIFQGKQRLRPENLIVFLQLVLFMYLSPTVWSGFVSWAIIITTGIFWFAFVSNNSAHHHPDLFHDGDEARPHPDFGLCQLDATASKTDFYHRPLLSVLTTFGDHPAHHLFPTICHGKLKYLKPILDETLSEFAEQIMEFTQWQLFVGTHKQVGRTTPNKVRIAQNGTNCKNK